MVRLANTQRDFTSSSKQGPVSHRFHVGAADTKFIVDISGQNGKYQATVSIDDPSDKTAAVELGISTEWVPGQRLTKVSLSDGTVENIQVLNGNASGINIIFRGSNVSDELICCSLANQFKSSLSLTCSI